MRRRRFGGAVPVEHGPQGPQGIQGPAGVAGAQGPTGAQGPPGASGQDPGFVATARLPELTAAAFLGVKQYGARVVVPRSGTLHDLAILVSAQSGNIMAGVYDTGDALAGSRTRLAASASVAVGAAGWQVVFDPALAVTQGQQLDLVFSVDNSTAQFARAVAATPAVLWLPSGFWPVAGGAAPRLSWLSGSTFALPATITEASMASTSTLFGMIARVA